MSSFSNSLAANVEASLSFTLATKLVNEMLLLDQQPWVLASMLFIVLSLFPDGENIMVQVLLLSLSRLSIYQASIHSLAVCERKNSVCMLDATDTCGGGGADQLCSSGSIRASF